ncbi:hypothetical protein IT575_12140 [bacterium]|nr:hypothetical protein [bacterium]
MCSCPPCKPVNTWPSFLLGLTCGLLLALIFWLGAGMPSAVDSSRAERRRIELLARKVAAREEQAAMAAERLRRAKEAEYLRNIEHYCIDPDTGVENAYMRYLLTDWQHRMTHQDGPLKGQFCPPVRIHYRMGESLLAGIRGDELLSLTMVEVFRGSAKTTDIVEAGAPMAIAEGRMNVVIVAVNAEEAKNRIQAITHELLNNTELLQRYPLLTPAKDDKGQWVSYTDTQIVFANGARLRAVPFGASLRGLLWNGKRPDFMIFDDVETEKLQTSEVEMKKAKKWVTGAIVGAMSAYGAIYWLFTPLSPNCLSYWLMADQPVHHIRQEFYDSRCRHCGTERSAAEMQPDPPMPCSVCEAEASPHWAEAWPPERIKIVRIRMKGKWTQEMRLVPLPDEQAAFSPSDFDDHSFNPLLLRGLGGPGPEYHGIPLSVFSWWDSAASLAETAARTAIVTVAKLPGDPPRFLVLDVRAGHWRQDKQVEHLCDVYRMYRPLIIGGQNTVLEKVIGPDALRRFGLPLMGYQQSNEKNVKDARIRSLSLFTAAGQVLFDHTQEAQIEQLRAELVAYPFHNTNDTLDSLEGAIKLALSGPDVDDKPKLSGIKRETSRMGAW